MRGVSPLSVAAALVVLSMAGPVRAEEGMWPFERVPVAQVESALDVRITQTWLDRLRAASVRIPGCSASLVSREGLMLTNNHCVVGCLAALSTPGADRVRDGFLTSRRDEEAPCAGMTAEVLLSTADITASVEAATAGTYGEGFEAARAAAIAAAERSVCRGAMVRCQTVPMFGGGRYVVYRYRRYTDVRLVFAPEFAAAAFGGDPDNFNFPRYALDAAFLRAYEHGRPVRTPNFLAWVTTPPREGEATFVSGNPGMTERWLTVSQLETDRDLTLPIGNRQRAALQRRLVDYGARGADEARRVATLLYGLDNSAKVFTGRLAVLEEPAFMDAKRREEAALRARIAADPALVAAVGDPWADIARAQQARAAHYARYRQLESEAGEGSLLFGWARSLVRAAREQGPSAQGRPVAMDARRSGTARKLLAPLAVEPALEQLYLEHWLAESRALLANDPAALSVLLGDDGPEDMAAQLVAGTRLADPAVRKALWDGGAAAIEASDDPMIRYALRIDAMARDVRQTWETEVSGPIDAASARIGRARLAVGGDGAYPEATFTLRLSYGRVAGWTSRDETVAPFTTIGGLFARATDAPPYALAPRWNAAGDRLDPATVLNFTTTNDIIGGNSGSPVVNARGEIIGAAFDGNSHSLAGVYGYDGAANRTVAVSTAAITAALTQVYGRTALVKELTGK